MAGDPLTPAGGGDGPDHPATAEQHHLAALAAEGRERQAAALAAEEAEERRIRREERRELERLTRPNIRLALLDSPRGKALALTALACGLVVLGTVLLLATAEPAEQRGWVSIAGLALVLGAAGLFFPARWLLGMRLERVERRWLQSLPFPVKGYFRVLSATPSEETRVGLRIRFRGQAPEREVLDGILGRVQFPASARLAEGNGATWIAESGPIRTVFVEDGTPSNAALLGWMRGVIDEALLPLHQAYPLGEVEFRE